MVRVVGLEPTLLSEPDFESGASTNFTTPAHRHKKPRPKQEAFEASLPNAPNALYEDTQIRQHWTFIF